MGAADPLQKEDYRQHYRDEKTRQDTEDEHTHQRGQGQRETETAQPVESPQLVHPHEPEDRVDHYSPEHRVREVPKQRREYERGKDRQRGCDHREQLRLRPGPVAGRGLACTPGGHKPLEHTRKGVRGAERNQFLVRPDVVAVGGGEPPGDADALGVPEEHDAQGGGEQARNVTKPDTGHRRGRQCRRNLADHGHAEICQVEDAGQKYPGCDHDKRRQ
jgi:hypothetical protein